MEDTVDSEVQKTQGTLSLPEDLQMQNTLMGPTKLVECRTTDIEKSLEESVNSEVYGYSYPLRLFTKFTRLSGYISFRESSRLIRF